MKKQFTYKNADFLKDGTPFRIISGALHYFRVVPEYWEDRLIKMKNFGCNTVETYVPWNLHEKVQGKFDFSGNLDLVKFIKTAEKVGLHVIVRPGPFICAEWEFGGLPAWLLADSTLRIRCYNEKYLKMLDKYLLKVMSLTKKLSYSDTGPVIMMQIENEYGAYGNDKAYLDHLRVLYEKNMGDMLLFTSDQPNPAMLKGGSAKGALMTANFGSRAMARFPLLKNLQSDAPVMCMEFWCGWFDHWGGPHHTRTAESAAKSLNEILSMNGSVNFYMFHGGTNFGFMNGANYDGKKYKPTVTSYDYDALLNECGDITSKYIKCREVISKFTELPEMPEMPPVKKISMENIKVTESASLFDNLSKLTKGVKSVQPLTMEQIGQDTGFILYRTSLTHKLDKSKLWIQDVKDRAQIFVDGIYQGSIYRNDKIQICKISSTSENPVIDILVENMGRVNYGPYMMDCKGITTGVQIDNQYLFNWEIFPLPLSDLHGLKYLPIQTLPVIKSQVPSFYKAIFSLTEIGDTFIDLTGWTKGNCYVNGFNVGRYWCAGPQQTLYIPAPLLKKGKNEIVVFELHNSKCDYFSLSDSHVLGKENFFKKKIINFFLARI